MRRGADGFLPLLSGPGAPGARFNLPLTRKPTALCHTVRKNPYRRSVYGRRKPDPDQACRDYLQREPHIRPNVEQWTDGTQFRYGSRVGCLVLSPSAKKGHVSHTLVLQVSLLKFCETTFGLAPLNARDAAADGMTDCFDFAQTPLGPPSAT